MPDICIYCQVHQPYRLRRFRLFDIGSGRRYFDADRNRAILRRVADKCYVPATRLLTDLVRGADGRFKVALSLSGTVLEQLADAAPDALESFQVLAGTGGAELLAETYYHSLAALADRDEFGAQVALHRDSIQRLFGVRPTVFRNTELIFSDAVAPAIRDLGFRAALVEGAGHVLEWRSPDYVYESAAAPGLRLLGRNYRLSDDIGFRFSNRDWDGWPLTADKWADWAASSGGDVVNVFLDYETFGEHQWEDTGIFEFLRHLPGACARRGLRFVHPSEAAARRPAAPLSFPRATSWADVERDVTAWLGNRIQHAAHDRLYRLGAALKGMADPRLVETWRRLTTSDHLYYMCTKWFNDGDVHKYFSPYESPYDAYIIFMNVLQDLELAVSPPAVPEEASNPDNRPAMAEMACVA